MLASPPDRSAPSSEGATFWEQYLAEHRHPVNRWMHVAGTLLGWSCVGVFAITGDWYWLLAAPVVGYGLAWAGHHGIEHNRPLTMSYPIRAWFCDQRMTLLMLCGQLPWRGAPSDNQRFNQD